MIDWPLSIHNLDELYTGITCLGLNELMKEQFEKSGIQIDFS
jgi:hypothetical protein